MWLDNIYSIMHNTAGLWLAEGEDREKQTTGRLYYRMFSQLSPIGFMEASMQGKSLVT